MLTIGDVAKFELMSGAIYLQLLIPFVSGCHRQDRLLAANDGADSKMNY